MATISTCTTRENFRISQDDRRCESCRTPLNWDKNRPFIFRRLPVKLLGFFSSSQKQQRKPAISVEHSTDFQEISYWWIFAKESASQISCS